jgi:hypothetical protein
MAHDTKDILSNGKQAPYERMCSDHPAPIQNII